MVRENKSGGGLQALLSSGSSCKRFYFFSAVADGFRLRMYTAAPRITIIARIIPGTVQSVPADGAAAVELVAGAIVVATVVSFETG